MEKTKKISVGDITVGGDSPLGLIAGLCVIENEAETMRIATRLKELTEQVQMPFIFKVSYDKANRTSGDSFRGPGLDEGLAILAKIKEKLAVPLLTDVHCCHDVVKVAQVADIVQIPAFLCRQTDLVMEVAKHAKCINIKKGQFLAPWDIESVIKKIEKESNNILITERGTCFGYNQLVTDMCALPLMRRFGYPVVFDATHSLQLPGGLGNCSGGRSELVPYVARAAVACGCDLVFLEVHPNPEQALSDGPNSYSLAALPELLEELKQIDKLVKKKNEK